MPENTREILTEIYSKHAPERLSDIDNLLQAYNGMETELVNQIRRKYLFNTIPSEVSATSVPSEPPVPAADEGLRMQRSKRRYLRASLIKAEVKKMLRSDNMLPQEVREEAMSRLARIEAAEIVSKPLPGGCDTLMGLQSSKGEAVPQQQALHVYLIPALEKQLLDKCRCLAQFYHHEEDGTLVQLPRQVQDMVNRINALRSSNIELEERLHQGTSQYSKQKVLLLQALANCIEGPKVKGQVVMDRKVTELTEFLTSIELKLALTKTQLLSETYTTQTIPALLCIRTVLNKHMQTAQKRSTKVRGVAREYSACGPELLELAREYRATQEKIADKRQQLAYLVANTAEQSCY
jgi:hypothetical protein